MLSKRFKIPHVSAGDIFREIAEERGVSLIELGRHAERNPEFDRELDERLMARAKRGGVVIDGRAPCFLAWKRKIRAFKIWLAARPGTMAERVGKREGKSAAEALAESRKREREVARRLKALWGLDTRDLSYYDLIVQTDGYTPKEAVALIVEAIHVWSRSSRA
jgi:predicted cytidylate kinase